MKVEPRQPKLLQPGAPAAETVIGPAKAAGKTRRSFFGYYNFFNFFSNFVVFYERLKFMKSLTDKGNGFHFMKQVLFLRLTHSIDLELFEDLLGCLLSGYNGVFLNLERILSHLVKELPSHEIDQYVLELNAHLFQRQPPSGEASTRSRLEPGENQNQRLFLKTCRQLSQMAGKSKSNPKQAQLQSYIGSSGAVNDHVLRFEFRADESMFVVHKVQSVVRAFQKQVT